MIGYTRRRRNAYFPVHTREPETIQDFRKTRSDQGFSKGSQAQIISSLPGQSSLTEVLDPQRYPSPTRAPIQSESTTGAAPHRTGLSSPHR